MKNKSPNIIFDKSSCLTASEMEQYNTGTLDAKEMNRMERHMLGCRLCRESMEAFAIVPITKTDVNELYHKIDTITETKKNTKNWWMVAAGFGGIMVLISIIYLLKNAGNDTIVQHDEVKVPTKILEQKFDSLHENNKIANEQIKPLKEADSTIELNRETKHKNATGYSSAETKIENKKQKHNDSELTDITEQTETTIGENSAAKEPLESNKNLVLEEPILSTTKSYKNDKKEIVTETISQSTTSTRKDAFIKKSKRKTEDEDEKPAKISAVQPNNESEKIKDNFVSTPQGDYLIAEQSYPQEEVVENLDAGSVEPRFENEYEKAITSKEEKTTDPERKYSYDDYLKSAITEYSSGDYSNAISMFNQILNQYPKDVNAIFYTAMSNYNTGKYLDAQRGFEALINMNNHPFKDESKWYYAQCLINRNQKLKAMDVLKEIASKPNVYQQKAKLKLGELKD